MIGWIIGIVTGILLLFFLWRGASKAFRERAEEPKYLFLENLGIAPPKDRLPGQTTTQTKSSQERKNGSTHS